MQRQSSYKVHLNTISNGELSDPLCDSVNRRLTLVRLKLILFKNVKNHIYWQLSPFELTNNLNACFFGTDRRAHPFVMLRERSTVTSDLSPGRAVLVTEARSTPDHLDNKLLVQRAGLRHGLRLANGCRAHSTRAVIVQGFRFLCIMVFNVLLISLWYSTIPYDVIYLFCSSILEFE